MLLRPFTLTLTIVLAASGQATPKSGMWEVSARLTGNGKAFGGTVPPTTTQVKQCITSELWARTLGMPTMPPQCTILSGGNGKANHRELNYACQYAPGRGLRVHMVTDLLSPEAVRVEATQLIETDKEVATTTNILTYTFLSDSCGAVHPETPPQ